MIRPLSYNNIFSIFKKPGTWARGESQGTAINIWWSRYDRGGNVTMSVKPLPVQLAPECPTIQTGAGWISAVTFHAHVKHRLDWNCARLQICLWLWLLTQVFSWFSQVVQFLCCSCTKYQIVQWLKSLRLNNNINKKKWAVIVGTQIPQGRKSLHQRHQCFPTLKVTI